MTGEPFGDAVGGALRERGAPDPFNALAGTYDAAFSQTLIGGVLRDAVRSEVADLFSAGDRILDLGCGTGDDAIWFVGRGVSVHGIDRSPRMISLARARRADAYPPDHALHGEAEFTQADLDGLRLPSLAYDGAFSNFGAINCVLDRRALAASLSHALKPGSSVVLVVMGRHCVWEWIWFLARGSWRTAFRRARPGTRFRGQPIFYPTPNELAAEFRPHFRLVRSTGIGCILPPTYAAGFLEAHPSAARALAALEARMRTFRSATALSDHYLAVFERS